MNEQVLMKLAACGDAALQKKLRSRAALRALMMRQREREKTASYYAVREMLGLDKEASQAPDGTQQEISYGAKNLLKARRGNTWIPPADTVLGIGIGSSVGNRLGAIARNAAIKRKERAGQKKKISPNTQEEWRNTQ